MELLSSSPVVPAESNLAQVVLQVDQAILNVQLDIDDFGWLLVSCLHQTSQCADLTLHILGILPKLMVVRLAEQMKLLTA